MISSPRSWLTSHWAIPHPLVEFNPISVYLKSTLYVDGVFCWCFRFSHNAIVPLEVLFARLGPSLPVPAVHGQLRCQACGSTAVEARPDWPSIGQVTRHLALVPRAEPVDPVDDAAHADGADVETA